MAEKERASLHQLYVATRSTQRCATTAMLRAAGFDRARVRSLVRRGLLHQATRSVYVIGDDILTRPQSLWVALLTGGADALLAGQTAAEQARVLGRSVHEYDILVRPGRDDRSVISLLPMEDTGKPFSFVLRSSDWTPDEARFDGLPTTSVARMLHDVAVSMGGEIAMQAWREADFLRLLDHDAIVAVCGSGHAGTAILRQLLEAVPIVQTDETDAQTQAEHRLIEELIRLGLPRPSSNQPLKLDQSWYFPDLWFALWRLVIEVDGPIHRRAHRAAQDRLRDVHMARHGIPVLRVDRDRVLADPAREARAAFAWIAAHRAA